MRTRICVLLFCQAFVWNACAHRSPLATLYDRARTVANLAALDREIAHDSLDVALLEWAIFHESNVQRQRVGLPSLRFDHRLRDTAWLHSGEMATLHYFDHFSPVKQNGTVRRRLDQVGIRSGVAGENLALHPVNQKQEFVYLSAGKQSRGLKFAWRNVGTRYTYGGFARDVVRRWLNSVGHRRNLLDPRFRFMGVGCVPARVDGEDAVYVTQDFSSTNY